MVFISITIKIIISIKIVNWSIESWKKITLLLYKEILFIKHFANVETKKIVVKICLKSFCFTILTSGVKKQTCFFVQSVENSSAYTINSSTRKASTVRCDFNECCMDAGAYSHACSAAYNYPLFIRTLTRAATLGSEQNAIKYPFKMEKLANYNTDSSLPLSCKYLTIRFFFRYAYIFYFLNLFFLCQLSHRVQTNLIITWWAVIKMRNN